MLYLKFINLCYNCSLCAAWCPLIPTARLFIKGWYAHSLLLLYWCVIIDHGWLLDMKLKYVFIPWCHKLAKICPHSPFVHYFESKMGRGHLPSILDYIPPPPPVTTYIWVWCANDCHCFAEEWQHRWSCTTGNQRVLILSSEASK